MVRLKEEHPTVRLSCLKLLKEIIENIFLKILGITGGKSSSLD